jgi:hypothetical protein
VEHLETVGLQPLAGKLLAAGAGMEMLGHNGQVCVTRDGRARYKGSKLSNFRRPPAGTS